MRIVTIDEGRPFVCAIEGDLDTIAAPAFNAFAGKLHSQGIEDIVFDMSKCFYVSSACLRVIVTMQKRAATGGSLVFRNVQPEVMEIFAMSGFDKILTFA